MVNRGWVIASIIGFLAIATFPFYWSLIGQDEPLPELLLPAGEKKCVESKQFMRADHMRLLHAWRTAVVRDQMLIYTAMDGVKYRMNLRDTCMGCHKNKEHFCDRCHEYSNITPPCWECHVAPPPLAGKKTSQIEKETSHTSSRAKTQRRRGTKS